MDRWQAIQERCQQQRAASLKKAEELAAADSSGYDNRYEILEELAGSSSAKESLHRANQQAIQGMASELEWRSLDNLATALTALNAACSQVSQEVADVRNMLESAEAGGEVARVEYARIQSFIYRMLGVGVEPLDEPDTEGIQPTDGAESAQDAAVESPFNPAGQRPTFRENNSEHPLLQVDKIGELGRLDRSKARLSPPPPAGAGGSFHPENPTINAPEEKLCLVIPPIPGDATLNALVRALERVDGSGGVVYTWPIEGADAVELEMDLPAMGWAVEEVRRRVPHLELTPISNHKLEARWYGS